ncbi:MAG: hypothetical protein KC483_00795 [Nitrosarchaeum sp.]|nr:hypothetical protein [Nitrosarchaeum sp.]
MTLKIMSGIVLPSKQNGYVEVMFDDHSIQHDSDANVVEKKTIGPEGDFKKVPAKIVSLRQIKVQVTTAPAVGGPSSLEKFKIGDYINKQRLKITWSADLGKIEEISYMVIGEV